MVGASEERGWGDEGGREDAQAGRKGAQPGARGEVLWERGGGGGSAWRALEAGGGVVEVRDVGGAGDEVEARAREVLAVDVVDEHRQLLHLDEEVDSLGLGVVRHVERDDVADEGHEVRDVGGAVGPWAGGERSGRLEASPLVGQRVVRPRALHAGRSERGFDEERDQR